LEFDNEHTANTAIKHSSKQCEQKQNRWRNAFRKIQSWTQHTPSSTHSCHGSSHYVPHHLNWDFNLASDLSCFRKTEMKK